MRWRYNITGQAEVEEQVQESSFHISCQARSQVRSCLQGDMGSSYLRVLALLP